MPRDKQRRVPRVEISRPTFLVPQLGPSATSALRRCRGYSGHQTRLPCGRLAAEQALPVLNPIRSRP
jgi:hypothetical protein